MNRSQLFPMTVAGFVSLATQGFATMAPEQEALIWFGGAGLFLIWMIYLARAEIRERWARRNLPTITFTWGSDGQSSEVGSWQAVVGTAVAISFFVLLIAYRPADPVWTHPALSRSEQDRAKADCEMLALEHSPGWHPSAQEGMRRYFDACLTKNGFVQSPAEE